MPNWVLPTLSEILACGDRFSEAMGSDSTDENLGWRVKAARQWRGAIAALHSLLQPQRSASDETEFCPDICPVNGLVLSGPLPFLSHPARATNFASWLFTPDAFSSAAMHFQLPPAAETTAMPRLQDTLLGSQIAATLLILPNDPLKTEKFCLVLTSGFSLVMVLGENTQGKPLFQFSFDPEVVEQGWQLLRSRVLLTGNSLQLQKLDACYKHFVPRQPDYKIVMRFTKLLLQYLPEPAPEELGETPIIASEPERYGIRKKIDSPTTSEVQPAAPIPNSQIPERPDVELLQAIAHEVKTPLATIRTFTRLLLKRRDLPERAIEHLKKIDRECSEQIDRFGLIFRAVELETSEVNGEKMPLTTTSLSQVFQQGIPRWKKQADRRNLTLDVSLPKTVPAVISDPTMLDRVLTGLIENFTSSLPTGSHVKLQVVPAGNQLKLQFHSQCHSDLTDTDNTDKDIINKPAMKSLGQMLMFQPETGNLSLNMNVTKNLFQAIGGKLIVRQRPQQGQVLTIFLPLN